MMDHYLLIDRVITKYEVYVDGQLDRSRFYRWAQWFEEAGNHKIGETMVGPYYISTIFLGLDHNWGGGAPVLFETMVFDHSDKEYSELFKRSHSRDVGDLTRRHHTIDEAEAYHAHTVKVLQRLMRWAQLGIPDVEVPDL